MKFQLEKIMQNIAQVLFQVIKVKDANIFGTIVIVPINRNLRID